MMESSFVEKWVGNIDITAIEACWQELGQHTGMVRESLGESAFILDTYLAAFFDTLNNAQPASEAGSDAYWSGPGVFTHCVRRILDGSHEEITQHPFYPLAEKYAEEHQLPKTVLLSSRMFSRMFHQYLKLIIDDFKSECANSFKKACENTGYYRKRSALVDHAGAENVEKLEALLTQHQSILPFAQAYAQGLLDFLNGSIIVLYQHTGELPL